MELLGHSYCAEEKNCNKEETKQSFQDTILCKSNTYCCEEVNYYKEHCGSVISLQSFLDFCERLRIAIPALVKRSQQTTPSFILGVVIGITITALLFQQNIIVGSYQNLRSDPLLGNGFVYHTMLPNLMPKVSSHEQQLETLQELPAAPSFEDVDDSYIETPVSPNTRSLKKQIENEVNIGAKVFVGVITAEKFLHSRAIAVNSTWGMQVDRIAFFTEHGTSEKYGIPVVNLDGVSDREYPPQKKSFKMLKHICEHHIDEYDWFVRADDDVYIRVDKLKRFLAQIDSDKLIYMGQPGHGVPEVREKLGLNGHNFCMGGPSVIFNRKALKRLCSHLDDCMTEVVSGEEDVEIGRCVSNHLHIECTHAWETLKLFYHSYQEEYTEEKPFLGNLAENIHVEKAITLHHVKVPYIMYKIHRHFTSLLLNSSSQAILRIRNQAHSINELLPSTKHRELSTVKIPPRSYEVGSLSDVPSWEAFNVESIFGLSPAVPGCDIKNDDLADLKQISETAIDSCIGHSASHLTYSHFSGGYFRTDPLLGAEYLLDIASSSKEEGKQDEIKRVHLLRPLSSFQITDVQEFIDNGTTFNFYVILPVHSCSASNFESFMRNYYEKSILLYKFESHKSPLMHVTLIVSLYENVPGEVCDTRDSIFPSVFDIVNWYRVKYPQTKLEIVSPISDDGNQIAVYGIDFAYTQGIKYAKKLRKNSNGVDFALISTTNFSLSMGLLQRCAMRTFTMDTFGPYGGKSKEQLKSSSNRWLYQPVPFVIYPAASAASDRKNLISISQPTKHLGYWDFRKNTHSAHQGLPICTTLDNFIALEEKSRSADKSPFMSSIYNSVYDSNYFMLRVPDKSVVNVLGR